MSFTKMLYSVKGKLSDNSPAILVTLGIVGFVGTVIVACKETPKAEQIIKEHDHDMQDIRVVQAKKASNDPEYADDEYTDADARKDKFIITAHTAGRLAKNYAPAILLGCVSIVCVLSSYKILQKRYAAASLLAASLSEAFLKYRERVAERFGEDVEQQLYFGAKEVEITEDNGKGKVKTEKVYMTDGSSIPVYAKFFDEANRQWNKDPHINMMFLARQEQWANDQFKKRGYLLLNEVYDMIDIPKTDLGSEVGWFESHGDQFVDFGMFNGSDERKRAFVNGYEPSILLCFNCVPKWKGDLEAV